MMMLIFFLPLRLLIYSFRNHPRDGLDHLSSRYVDYVGERKQNKKKVRKQRSDGPAT